jgi:hypothetical protein
MLEASSTGEKYGHPGNCIGSKVLVLFSNFSIGGLPNNKLCTINGLVETKFFFMHAD